MGLYRVRLYNLATMDKDMNLYEAYRVGFIIVSNGIFNCEEVLDKGKIPIVDKRKDYAIEDGEHIDSFHIHLNSRIAGKRHIVLREDFCKKNRVSKEKTLELRRYSGYARIAVKIVSFEQKGPKKLLK